MSINDGGPAYPVIPPITADGHEPSGYPYAWSGMSLRDKIAIAALPWCLSEFAGNAEDQEQAEKAAYQIADNMMKAREIK